MPYSSVRVRADIAAHGWHVVMVPDDEEGPGFAYTVGLGQTFGHPEVIVFGLPLDIMHLIVNNVGEEVRRGRRFGDGDSSGEVLEGHPVEFRAVSPAHYDEFLGQAVIYYGDAGFTALQCYWPDASGRFPWQLGYGVGDSQPSLQAEPTRGDA